MTNSRRQVLVKLFTLSDLGIMSASFALAALPESYLTAHVSLASFLSMRIKLQNIVVFLGLLAVWHSILSGFGLYQSRRLGNRRSEMRDAFRATLTATLAIIVAGLLFRIRMVTPVVVICFWLVSTSVILSSRLVLRSILKWVRIRGHNLRHIVIVGTNPRALRFARTIESTDSLGYRLIGFIDEEWIGTNNFSSTHYHLVADFERFPAFLREHVVDEVAIALPMKSYYSQAASIVEQCEQQGILVRCLTDLFALQGLQGKPDEFDRDPAIPVYSHLRKGWPNIAKRVIDVAISLAVLVTVFLLLLITAVLIKFDSPGPIFFSQERVGLNKRRFRMYKFRTMVDGAERMQPQFEKMNEVSIAFKIKNDPRVTRVGKILRRSSIDELPQFLNVLKGDMSLVGPRPLPLRDYQAFNRDWHRRRFTVRPGITCLWQINGRSSLPFEKWMELDMQYIDHWSLWLDLKILAKTMPAVLKGAGAA
jgi:exopolysaccharide biosynthesis polyprenyl glycosylphosphotransferase